LSYAWTYFWTGLLIPLTLGWIVPWRSTRLQGLISNGMRFGDRTFHFTAPSGPLYSRFAILWLAAIVIMFVASSTIGVLLALVVRPEDFQPDVPPGMPRMAALLAIVYGVTFGGFLIYGIFSAWYRAGMMNHFAAHTTFEGASFRGSATAGSLMWLTVSNYLMVLLTLGLLSPLAQARSARYFVERISIQGEVPLAQITQRAEDPIRRGEGLAQAFDVDAF
jgi:uncharacterized membrane protein YjgN (DUF898 family)